MPRLSAVSTLIGDIVQDFGGLFGVGEGVLHAVDRGGDEAFHQVRLGGERRVGRDDAVAVKTQAGIGEAEADQFLRRRLACRSASPTTNWPTHGTLLVASIPRKRIAAGDHPFDFAGVKACRLGVDRKRRERKANEAAIFGSLQSWFDI